jgi:phospholipid/cholesterol/gamma-HCH transport system substrate-binding protein
VRFNGIQVGEVTDLGLNPDNPGEVIARIRVDVATPVKVDSVAQLEPQGLTGLSYIQISSGSPDAARLESRIGDRAPRIYANQAQLEELVQGGESLLESAQLTFHRVGRLPQ